MMPQPNVYETHMHTQLCRHAIGEPEEYAAVAAARGLAGMIVTCHNPMPESYGHSGRMREDEMDAYLSLVDRARCAYQNTLDIRVGIEADYFPGYEEYVANQLRGRPFEYVIGSVHPHLAIWRRRFCRDGAAAAQRNYFDQLAEAAETGLFDCISHPDLIKNQTADEWFFNRIADDVGRCLDRIAATGTAMELNTSGLLKHIPEMNPCPPILAMMRQRGIAVVVGADAHEPHRVSECFEEAYDLLEDAGYEQVSFFLDRKRREIPIDQARASLVRHPTIDV